MLHFKINSLEQRNAIEGLAYHVADAAYISERYSLDDPEYIVAHNNTLYCFAELDLLGVPFWVQNSIIAFAGDWRQYKRESMSEWLLKNRSIDLAI